MDPKIKTAKIGICISMFALMVLVGNFVFVILTNGIDTNTLISNVLLFVSIVAIFFVNLSIFSIAKPNKQEEIKQEDNNN